MRSSFAIRHSIWGTISFTKRSLSPRVISINRKKTKGVFFTGIFILTLEVTVLCRLRPNTEGHAGISKNIKQEISKRPGHGIPSTLRTTSTVNNEDITTTNNDLLSHNFDRKYILNTSEFAGNKEDNQQKLHTFSFVKILWLVHWP